MKTTTTTKQQGLRRCGLTSVTLFCLNQKMPSVIRLAFFLKKKHFLFQQYVKPHFKSHFYAHALLNRHSR